MTAVGDVIEDATGLRPANNFDETSELNIYAPPNQVYAGTAIGASYDTLPEYLTTIGAIITKCSSFDLLAIDSNNLVALLMGQLSGHLEFPQLMGQWIGKIMLQRRNATQMQNINLIKLAS